MMCIILAAGYATRLYPLTQNFPKPLLKIRDKTILDLLIDDIETTKEVSEYIVVTNHKYYNHFLEWSKTKTVNISIIDNGTETNETRLGAVKDIQFAVKQKNIKEDFLLSQVIIFLIFLSDISLTTLKTRRLHVLCVIMNLHLND